MSGRIVRGTRSVEFGQMWFVAGAAGAVEFREGRNGKDAWSYILGHSPRRVPGWRHHAIEDRGGLWKRGCYLLEGPCWSAMLDGLPSSPPWTVLEALYEEFFGG